MAQKYEYVYDFQLGKIFARNICLVRFKYLSPKVIKSLNDFIPDFVQLNVNILKL